MPAQSSRYGAPLRDENRKSWEDMRGLPVKSSFSRGRSKAVGESIVLVYPGLRGFPGQRTSSFKTILVGHLTKGCDE